MNILVLGANGMAGHFICMYFKERGHEVTAFSRKQFGHCRHIFGDATDFERLKTVIAEGGYDAVVNAVGILNREAENHKAMAVMLNSCLPHHLSEVTRGTKTKIVQISTDCVFSGKMGAYTETSVKDGEAFYDRSKALGELVNDKDLTFRTSIVGPDPNPAGIGLLNWFMQQGGSINGYTEAFWTGVTTHTLAQAIEKALEQRLTGLYHLVNKERISKFNLLTLFNRHLRDGAVTIVPSGVVRVDKSLINNRSDFDFWVPDYENMVIEMKHWMIRHAPVYPHYFRSRPADS